MSKPLDDASWVFYVAERPKGYETLYRFIKAVENGEQPPQEDCEHIADALREILHGGTLSESLDSFSETLDLKGKRGRPKRTANEADEELGKVYTYVAEVLARQENGSTKEVALEDTAYAHGINEETLRDWYKRQRIPAQVVRATLIRQEKKRKDKGQK